VKRRFDFRLQRVLALRELEEKGARIALGEGEVATREAEEVRADARSTLHSERTLLGERLGNAPMGPAELKHLVRSQAALDLRGHHLRGLGEMVKTRRERADRLASAWREREAARRGLDELRGRGLSEHRREIERDDAKEMDEGAQRRAIDHARPKHDQIPENASDPGGSRADLWRRCPVQHPHQDPHQNR